ncbi:MAG: pyrroline-5-carboxylate reductase [Clostridia bacterium]|nr:pyrroline-5-carboxylate reductase [Clostridia bacterium]
MIKVGFIGTGVMGGALARAVRKKIPGEALYLSNVPSSVSEALAAELGAKSADNIVVSAECKYIVLAVKPNMIRTVIAQIAPVLKQRKDRFIVVSVAAGITVQTVKEEFGFELPVIRIMPNTPALVGGGVILSAFDSDSANEKDEFLSLLSEAGYCEDVGEKMIETAGTLTGCGPAFAFVIMQALADGAVAVGVDRKHAVKYAELTIAGAAKLALESGKHLEQLKDEVCSPGGSTIEGVTAMENAAVRAAMIEAVKASYEKNLKLGKK